MKIANLAIDEIKNGDIYSFNKKILKEDVFKFADITGDYNPLHVDKNFGKKSKFKRNIAHGMLAGSLFSTLVGMHCPGKNALYLSQTLSFKFPIFYGDALIVKGTVIAKNDSINLIKLKTEIIKNKKVCISGEAKIKILKF